MDNRVFSVYNSARGALLNSMLKVAESTHQPLKLLDQLISGLGLDSQSGLWLIPVASAPLVPRVFPFDFVYLDKNQRVLHAAEIGPGIDFPPYDPETASALVLPSGRILASKTVPGDSLVICLAEELEALLGDPRSTSAAPDSTNATTPGKTASTPRSTRRKCSPASSGTPDRNSAPPALEKSGSASDEPADAVAVASTPLKDVAAAGTSSRSSLEESIQKAVSSAENAAPASLDSTPPRAELQNPSSLADEATVTTPAVENARLSTPASTPKPSISITEVEGITDRARIVPPAIVEHHTDPEDLFSNWVVTPSANSAWIVENGFDSPIPSRPPAHADLTQQPESTQFAASANAEPKSSQADAVPPAATPDKPASIEAEADHSSTLPPNLPQSPSVPGSQKPVASLQSQTPGMSVPQISTTTTFSPTLYNMWQVSMPTAVAPVSPVQSPTKPTKIPPEPSSTSAPPDTASTPASGPAKPAMTRPPASPAPLPATHESNKSAPADSPVPARRSTDKPAETFARPTTAQFVSSMQERLERLQQTRSSAFELPKYPAPAQASESVAKKPAPLEPKPSSPATLSPAPQSSVPPPASTPSPVNNSLAAAAINVVPPAPDPRPRTSAPEVPKIKTAPPLSTLRSKFKKWLNPSTSPSDRRRADRHYVPGMVAHYFTGGAPKPHSVADISMTGFYLLTEDRWMPGTMIQMTLQKPTAKGERKQSITVLSRVVRRGSDGVATEFVMPGTLDPYSHDVPPSQTTDKFALARFL